MDKLAAFLAKTKELSFLDQADGHGQEHLFRSLVSEVGEYAEAVEVELGIRNKPLEHSSKEEAVDVIMCAIGLFYLAGGSDEELAEIGLLKAAKWERGRNWRRPTQ